MVLLTACADVQGPSIPDGTSSVVCPDSCEETGTIVITVTVCPDCP